MTVITWSIMLHTRIKSGNHSGNKKIFSEGLTRDDTMVIQFVMYKLRQAWLMYQSLLLRVPEEGSMTYMDILTSASLGLLKQIFL